MTVQHEGVLTILSTKHGICSNCLQFLLLKGPRVIPTGATIEKLESKREMRKLEASTGAEVKIRINIIMREKGKQYINKKRT